MSDLNKKLELAERGGFEPSRPNPLQPILQADSANDQATASQTASQKAATANPELSEIFQSWPKLPANARLAILALIRATLHPK